MYCRNCGNQLNEGAVFCPCCGFAVYGVPQPEAKENKPRKVNGLSLAGFIITLASIALGYLAGWINHIHYTGFNFQFLFAFPLVASFILSIIGTVKSKKIGSGKGLGIAGAVISGLIITGTVFYYLFAESLAKLAFTFILFFIPFL